VLFFLDADTARSETRKEITEAVTEVKHAFANNHAEVGNFELARTEDLDTWPEDLADRTKCPSPAITVEKMVDLYRWKWNTEEGEWSSDLAKVHTKYTPLIMSLVKRLHSVEWCLDQLNESMKAIQDNPPAIRIAAGGKVPTYVQLLSEELQAYIPAEAPLPLARHRREESIEQEAVRTQRDDCWAQVEKYWIDQRLTWGKLPDKV
jgi:hypothetical protein